MPVNKVTFVVWLSYGYVYFFSKYNPSDKDILKYKESKRNFLMLEPLRGEVRLSKAEMKFHQEENKS